MKQYQVVIFQEKGIATLLLGAGKIDPVTFTSFLNSHAQQ
jgi:hypothetical protein